MVYFGVPSKSCGPCRLKRTKCDLGKPICRQCKRTGRSCGGYRDQSSFQIRDQTEITTIKHQTSLSKDERIQTQNGLATEAQSQMISPSQNARFPLISLPKHRFAHQEDSAVIFFFNDYVLEDSMVSHNLFDVLPTLYRRSPPGSAMSNALVALGLVCLSNTLKTQEVIPRATSKYIEALRLINEALRSPEKAKLDETLIIVMLLGLFEENKNTNCLDGWNNHINGAMALLDYRGEEQLCRHISLKSISALRSSVIISALVRRTTVPEKIIKWSRLARQHEGIEESAESELAEIIAEFCNLRARFRGSLSSQDRTLAIEQALEIEFELAEWAASNHIKTFYATLMSSANVKGILGSHWHMYYDLGLAASSNYYRSARIHVNQMLVTYLSELSSNSASGDIPGSLLSTCTEQIISSKLVIKELAQDICASVPCFLGSPDHTVPLSLIRVCGKLLLWPLYVAGQTEYVPETMRIWVAERLDILSDIAGLTKAAVLANMLRTDAPLRKAWREQIPEEAWYSSSLWDG